MNDLAQLDHRDRKDLSVRRVERVGCCCVVALGACEDDRGHGEQGNKGTKEQGNRKMVVLAKPRGEDRWSSSRSRGEKIDGRPREAEELSLRCEQQGRVLGCARMTIVKS